MDARKFAFYGFSTYIFLYSFFCVSSAQLKTYYVEDLCNEWSEYNLHLKNGISGILSSVPTKHDSGECTIRLRPVPGFSVVLSIYRFSLGLEDQLVITDSDNFNVALIGEGDFPDERKSFTSDGPLNIRYVWNSTEHVGSRLKFQFVFTQVHGAPCRFDEFQCRNKKCVSKDLVCDRHNHCGDNSDQQDCGQKTKFPQAGDKITVKSHSNVWIISIIVCSVILAIVIIVFIALVVRSNIRRKKMQAAINSLPTVAVTMNSPPTVTASVPHQSPSAPPAPPSVFERLRQSLRRTKPPASSAPHPEEPKTDNYEVPSMYPEIPSAPHHQGIDNPEFKGDDN